VTPRTTAEHAYRSSMASQALTVVGLSIDAMFWSTTTGRAPPLHLLGAAVAAVLLGALLATRRRARTWVGAAALLADVVVVLVALWATDDVLARSAAAWVPFQPQKLALLTIALLAPTPAWVGALAIGAYTAVSVAHFLAFPPEIRARVALEEPWATIAFGAFALGLLAHRKHAARAERAAHRAQLEAQSIERLARIALAVRDLSNTPVQTLQLVSALLRSRHPADAPLLDRMDRSIARLEALDRALSTYEAQVDWTSVDASFDPVAVIEGRAP
jgi:hypothetical protein